jgi:pimeloyl-ACP methyl ester carboxylesterase
VALLHGFGGTHGVWCDIARRLASDHRVIAYDLPGHGLSLDYADGGAPKVAARAVIDDLRARGDTRVHLVGHSMGGAIALLAALSSREIIASLMLAAPGGIGETINADVLRRFAAAHMTGDIADCLRVMSTPETPDAGATAQMLAEARHSPAQRGRLIEIADLITKGGRQGRIPPEVLATLRIPVSVLWGTRDPVLPVDQARNLPAAFELRLLDGAGHMLIEEAPDAIIAMVRAQTANSSRLIQESL